MPKLPAFSDVQSVMDQAAARPSGLRYRTESWGQAINFRQRAYRFRKEQQRIARETFGMVPGYISTTPYDDLELFITDSRGTKLRSKPEERSPFYDVVIRHREAAGQILDIDTGEEINLHEPPEGLDLE